MKKTNLYLAATMLIIGFSACNGNQGTTSSTDSTSTRMNPGDSSVTTTTTTTITHHRYSGTFTPQPNQKYIDLRTHKEVTVRIDTVRGEIVNSETNEPIDLFVMPATHDTIYGQTGTVVNNDLTQNANGDYIVDTMKLNNTPPVASNPTVDTVTLPDGKYREKDKRNKDKVKTEDYRLKEKKSKLKETDK